MRLVYSFVIDEHPRFLTQARTFLTTLKSVGVKTDDIIAHLTPNAVQHAKSLIEGAGVTWFRLEPVLDGRYCNKIGQLDVLSEIDCDGAVLCDTDIAFADQLIRFLQSDSIAAKPVDFPNPPIDRLDAMRVALGIAKQPVLAKTTCTHEPTYASNCNGGVYVIPRQFLGSLKPAWRECAELAMAQAGQWAMHADQIGFALATLRLDIPVKGLPVEYNFPMHVPQSFPEMQFSKPRVLHYHGCHDEAGRLVPTGDVVVDGAVHQINSVLEASSWATLA